MGKKIDKVCEWLVNIANDNSHGYSQDKNRRWNNPDFDCSSLIIYGWREIGGLPLKSTFTGNMRSDFVKNGFKAIKYQKSIPLLKGDILLNEQHHVVTYLGDGTIVHASSSETGGKFGKPGDQTGGEICIRSMYDYKYGWDYILRYAEDDEPTTGNPYKEPTSTLSIGSKGPRVSWLQWELVQKGYNLQIDGDFGKLTKAALIDFQKKAFPNQPNEWDGICGPKTRAALKGNTISVPEKPKNPYSHNNKLILKRGSKNESVRWLQWELNQRGNYGLAIDGSFGPATAKALADWQSKNGLVADSICGSKTFAKLES